MRKTFLFEQKFVLYGIFVSLLSFSLFCTTLHADVLVANYDVPSSGQPGDGYGVLQFNQTTGAPTGNPVPNGSGGLGRATGVTFGPDGTLYVSSSPTVAGGHGEVLHYSASGTPLSPTVFADLGADSLPAHIEWHNNQLYVANNPGNAVQIYDANGSPAGTVGNVQSVGGFTFGPTGMYLGDFNSGDIYKPDGSVFIPGAGTDPTNGPYTPGALLWVPNGTNPTGTDLLVVDLFGDRILRFDSNGNPDGVLAPGSSAFAYPLQELDQNGQPITGDGLGDFPSDVVYDPVSGHLLVAIAGPDHGLLHGRIEQYDLDGNFLGYLTTGLPASVALTLTPVPEPATWILAILGAGAVAIASARRSRRDR